MRGTAAVLALASICWTALPSGAQESPPVASQDLRQLGPLKQYDLVVSLSDCKTLYVGLNRDAAKGPLVHEGASLIWLCRRTAGRKADCTFVDAASGDVMTREVYDVAFEAAGELFLNSANGATKLLTHDSAAVMSSIIILERNAQGGTGLVTKSCTGLKMTGDEAQALLKGSEKP